MRRGLLIAIAAAGCRFEPGAWTDREPTVDAASIDTTTPDESVTPDGVPPTPFCDGTDTTLVACYEFENTTQDGSPNALHPVSANVSYVTGKSGMAVRISASSAMDVPEDSALDVQYITMEAWIRPSMLPATRSGIVDNGGQYSIYLIPTGVRCDGFDATVTIPTNDWTHVACVIDTAHRIYINGTLANAGGGGGPLGTGGTSGMSIGMDNPPGSGQQLIGDLDQFRMFSAPRTPEQICAAAGRTSC